MTKDLFATGSSPFSFINEAKCLMAHATNQTLVELMVAPLHDGVTPDDARTYQIPECAQSTTKLPTVPPKVSM